MDYTKKSLKLIALSSLFLLLFLPTESLRGETNASLYVAPSSGTYSVGDTFTASIYVNTAGESVNAVEASLSFPPDKLQVVSPSSGKSVIALWLGQPDFSNEAGTLTFRGAIPNPGLISREGLISTVTFRVRAIGKVSVTFNNDSKVLLNDGLGTDILGTRSGAVFDLVLPPPQGPVVVSSSHPDQTRWYPSDSLSLAWDGGGADAYSYLIDGEPITVPDNAPETTESSASFAEVGGGVHYFHIKARRSGVWGGVSHYVLRADVDKPAKFDIHIEPGLHTSTSRPIIEFRTTDSDSGVSFYEVKIVGLSASASSTSNQQPFFVESASPYLPQLTPGNYEVVVRAHDEAGNIQESKSELQILSSTFNVLGVLPQGSLWFLLLFVCFVGVGFYLYRSSRATMNKESSVDLQ